MKYIAGNNAPGYLPDSDPEVHDDFGSARAAVIEMLLEEKKQMELCRDGFDATDVDCAIEMVNLWRGPNTITIYNRAYWVQVE